VENRFFCNKPYINLYEFGSIKSNISSQILYGEEFKILERKKSFLKIKTNYDNYIGYIKTKKFLKEFKETNKISVLKSRIFTNPNSLKTSKTKKYLPFSSKINIIKKKNNFVMYEKNKWIKSRDIEPANKKNKNILKILKLFLNCKYRWGGKTYDGIDCSALIQLVYKFNNKFFPRDTVDQIKFKRGTLKKRKFKLGDIIYWKGHVAICISSRNLIHAYGPRKKVLVMQINKTIKIIKKTANLEVKNIFTI
tara:strand:- start:85 stop:837 length:753 start_codon:yes stop_codon:yes gene_type:complete